MTLNNYRMIGGVHPETASIKNVLAYYGVNAPHTNKPFSEAMLLGIGGGLGSTYILWEFEKHGYPSIVLAFRNKANYAVKYLETLCGRLGASTQVFETTGKKKATTQLEKVLAGGDPAIAWIDFGGAPYYMHYLQVGVVVVYGKEDEYIWIDNLAIKPYIIESDLMVEARAKVPSFKNRLMVVEPKESLDLEKAIQEGLQDCVEYLGSSSTSFALPAIRKWGRMIMDKKNSKGWPTVFENGIGLYGTLRTIYEGIELIGTGGGGLRGMYADFLVEAASILNREDFLALAKQYRDLHDRWKALAQAALPDHVEEFKSTKQMLDQRSAITLEKGSAGLDDISPISDALHDLKGDLNQNFPLNQSERDELLRNIQHHVVGIYEAEKEALTSLQSAVEGFA